MRRSLAVAVAVSTLAIVASVAAPGPTLFAAELDSEAGYQRVREMLSQDRATRRAAAAALTEAADPSLVPALVDALFFTPRERRGELYAVLTALTGEKRRGYYDWVEYVGSREEPRPKPGYANFKVAALAEIDPGYREIFYSGAAARIRLEEIVSGGVRIAGIPALDDPPTIPGGRARYLTDDELVFGVELNGEARAYPFRFLSWHEMANDRLGGEPITLSFCTLCGSGIVYSGRLQGGTTVRFDTSGLLYRSNKLMLDRETKTLWSNLTGEPVVGRMARSGTRLTVLPSTVSTWKSWRERHPETTTLDLKAIRRTVDRRYGFDYQPGAADRARRGVAFPVWLQSDALDRDAEVYALTLGGTAKAYSLDRLLDEALVHDEIDGRRLVLVTDREGRSVRAYQAGDRRFSVGTETSLVDAEGGRWAVREEALVSESGATLERIPGHVAYWFGWYAFHPRTELWK